MNVVWAMWGWCHGELGLAGVDGGADRENLGSREHSELGEGLFGLGELGRASTAAATAFGLRGSSAARRGWRGGRPSGPGGIASAREAS